MGDKHNILTELFSANTMLQQILKTDFSIAWQVLSGFAPVFVMMFLGIVIHLIPERCKSWYRTTFANLPYAVQFIVTLLVVIGLYQAYSSDSQPFIYFQF